MVETDDHVVLFLVDKKQISRASLDNCYSGLRFLYKEILNQGDLLREIKRPRPDRKLPVVLSRGDVKRVLEIVENLKHRMILALVYAGGLRVGEVVRLKVSDIDSQRMMIRIRQGKGRKDRYTLLPQAILEELRYPGAFRP